MYETENTTSAIFLRLQSKVNIPEIKFNLKKNNKENKMSDILLFSRRLSG